MAIKRHFEDVMYGRRRAVLLGPVLGGLSLCYGMLVRMRLALHRRHILRSWKLPCRVISVGNITVGGTGKTPVVIEVAKFLRSKGCRPAIISRGYGRDRERKTLVVSNGVDILTSAAEGGDEPLLMAGKLTGVPVIVGADRYAAGMTAIRDFNADVLVLDDGFQHVRLQRDLDILLLDSSDPFGNGKLFPAGILREPLSSLGRADSVVVTKISGAEDLDALKVHIGRFARATVFTSSQRAVDLVDIASGAVIPLSALSGKPVLAFSGIARPLSFFSLLQGLGAELRGEMAYEDHYRYTASDLEQIYQRAEAETAALIITTEKDAVRLRSLRAANIWALRIEHQIAEMDAWERLLAGKA